MVLCECVLSWIAACSLRAASDLNALRDSMLNYWDNYPFHAALERGYRDSLECSFDLFAQKIPLLSATDRLEAVARMLDRASIDKRSYLFVAKLSEACFHGQALFVGQDEVYRKVLKHLISSSLLSETEKVRPRFQWGMLQKNAVGHVASDFSFTMRDGCEMTLCKMPETMFRWMIFFDPSCVRCQVLVNKLRHHEGLNRAISANKVQVLAVCVSEDVPAWERIKDDLPQNWVVGLGGNEIWENSLYDLRYLPAIYVLGGNRKVIYKHLPADSCLEVIEELVLQK